MGTLGYGVGSGNDQITGILLIFPLQLHGWGAVSFGPWGRVLQKGLQVCSKEISFIWGSHRENGQSRKTSPKDIRSENNMASGAE